MTMSEAKKGGEGGGLFVSKKPKATGTNDIGLANKPKDVKKRWLYVAVGAAAFGVVASSLLSPTKPPPIVVEEKPAVVDVTPKGVQEKTLVAKTQGDIQNLKAENERLRTEMQQFQADMETMRRQRELQTNAPGLPAGVVPPPAPYDTPAPALPPIGGGTAPLTQAPPPGTTPTTGGSLQMPGGLPPPLLPPMPETQPVRPMVFKPEKPVTPGPEYLPTANADIKLKKNELSGMLIAGGFAPVVLLNGIDAGTSQGARSNPQPVLMNIQDHAMLPGAAKYELRSCFLLGSGYGDLSSERVYIRLARLSCIDKSRRLILSEEIQGYVVDSDNTLGMRGIVTDRQGSRLAKAMLAGFAEGLAGALGTAQTETTSSALGTVTSLTGEDALKASGLSGAQNAASQLATFYLNEAQNIFPIISVSGGRAGTVVITEDVNLRWGSSDAQFIQEISPRSDTRRRQ
jgi:conjugal transfer pilus assembly protein TraB